MLVLTTRVPMKTKRPLRETIQPRKTPLQARSVETVAVIVEAAARVLEVSGFEGFNTNAVAQRAGVSIGSVYQYFPNKDALLSGLIEREVEPLLASGETLRGMKSCRTALKLYIAASVRHQMKRPQLASLIDVAERRDAFRAQVSRTRGRLHANLEAVLTLPGAPVLDDRSRAASDVLAIVRGMVDAAGERGETDSSALLHRVNIAVWGYLRGMRPA